jgi:hypothetical protein
VFLVKLTSNTFFSPDKGRLRFKLIGILWDKIFEVDLDDIILRYLFKTERFRMNGRA